jgi:hypothetical protein
MKEWVSITAGQTLWIPLAREARIYIAGCEIVCEAAHGSSLASGGSTFSAHCSCSPSLSDGAIAGLVNNGTTSKPAVGMTRG